MGRWIQLNDANWRIPYVGGWCEGYVEGAWGQATRPTPSNQTTSGVYATAIAAWNAQPVKHTEEPPKGITVPVYFSLGNVWQGHVAIRLDDGYVASSTQAGYHPVGYLHPNINNLISLYGQYNGGCTYLGWGEYVGRVKVVGWEDYKDERYSEVIPFEEITEEDPNLPANQSSIKQVGVNGERWWVDTIRTVDGVEQSRVRSSEGTTPSVPQITVIGTYVEPDPLPDPEPTPDPDPEDPVPVPPVDTHPNIINRINRLLKHLIQFIIDQITNLLKGVK